ncbi:hypothetical protein N7468_008243 [Penicillium chermesinum]|uniref:Signal peptidase subunit 3 n=1 Tax=Penicillium chermesinum TaxID=63820 RepID=A0A9W9TI64_9EURO|nr:uncharacterized protein N7468_008243 [Penicillium chermesinum]KAJ5223701.1 hypothetical protein N7468_008243 [Penicillium chermesinum]
MHSALNRVQAVFGFFTTVALVVAAAAALSTLLFPTADTTASVQLKNVQVVKGRPHYYSTKREEYAQFRFDLDADLTPLFNWNTKQVFVYVYATYSSSDNPNTREILRRAPLSLTEKISPTAAKRVAKNNRAKARAKKTGKKEAKKAPEPAPGVLRLRGQKAKYQIGDVTGVLAERHNVSLAVGWNVQPWVGALWWSPGSGAVPRTEGTVLRSAAFDLPELKGKKPEGQQV